MALSPSLGESRRCGSHFVSGGGQKVAVVSRHTRACPLVPPTLSSRRLRRRWRRHSLLFALVSLERRHRFLPCTLSSSPAPAAPSRRGPHLHLRASQPPRHRPSRLKPLFLRSAAPLSSSVATSATHRPLLRIAVPPPTATPAPLPLSATRSPPSSPPAGRVHDIITPFYSRFIGLYQLHRTVADGVSSFAARRRHRDRATFVSDRTSPGSLNRLFIAARVITVAAFRESDLINKPRLAAANPKRFVAAIDRFLGMVEQSARKSCR